MLTFTRQAADAVATHAHEGAPAEVCGVLGGSRGQSSESDGDAQHDRVTDVYRTENVAESPRTRYRIDPERQLAVLEQIDAEGLDVVGFYHSHPAGPAEPSETDAARATWRGYAYVIWTPTADPALGAWRWRGSAAGFEQESLRVADRDGS
jgi:proteasome lid subunit RPN8/RPN11